MNEQELATLLPTSRLKPHDRQSGNHLEMAEIARGYAVAEAVTSTLESRISPKCGRFERLTMTFDSRFHIPSEVRVDGRRRVLG